MSSPDFHLEKCEQFRTQLDAYLSNELPGVRACEMSLHLERCEKCSLELASRMRVREALRKAVASESPPERLEEAIHRRLTKTRSGFFAGFSSNAWAIVLTGFSVLVVAGFGAQQWLRLQQGRQTVAGVLALGASDHIHCAIESRNYRDEGRASDQLQKELGQEYGALLDTVRQGLPGFQVLEAHQCSVPGSPRKYVHFIARGRGTILSAILTRREGKGLLEVGFLAATSSGGINIYRAHLNGMEVAGFEANDYWGFVVSDLGRRETMRLAEGLAPAVLSALPSAAEAQERKLPALPLLPFDDRPRRAHGHYQDPQQPGINLVSMHIIWYGIHHADQKVL